MDTARTAMPSSASAVMARRMSTLVWPSERDSASTDIRPSAASAAATASLTWSVVAVVTENPP